MIKRIFVLLVLTGICIQLLISPFDTVKADDMIEHGETPFASDRLIVKFRPEVNLRKGFVTTNIASLDSRLSQIKSQEITKLRGFGNIYKLKVNEGTDILHAVKLLNADPAVEYAEPDYLAKFASAPDDPRYSEQWGLSKIVIEDAWDLSMGSSNVIIAVVDSGIDLLHEDLSPNLWINPGEIPGNSLDDDNNGFIDDIQGWNFVDDNNNIQDYVGHGSMVSGIAAASTNNSVGIAGVCGNCRIMPVKVSQVSGFANYSDIAEGVIYASQKGADVINISLGGYANSAALSDAISQAADKGIIVVAGAGNDNKSDRFYPAAYDDVIAVSGLSQGDEKTSSSNFGPWVDISAPGEDLLTTTLGDYVSSSGTSFAAPFVTGAAGLLLSLHPEWTPTLIQSQFLHTTDAIDGLNPGLEGMLGSGRLNASLALQTPQPILTYQSYTANGMINFRPDFGSTINLTVSLNNDWADANDVIGVLTSVDEHVTITNGTVSFGNILAGEARSNQESFTFDIASEAGYNHTMSFTLDLTANGGEYSTSEVFNITTRTSEEIVSGTIDMDTVWTSDLTYKVTGNVGVVPGTTLTIQPGTTVQFAGDYYINIGGSLIASGTQDQPILFEPYSEGTSWQYISFADASTDAETTVDGEYLSGNILEYVVLKSSVEGIDCVNATPYIKNVETDMGGLTCSLGSTDLHLMDSTITGTVNISQGGGSPEKISGLVVKGGETTLPTSQVLDSNFHGALTINGSGQVNNVKSNGLLITSNGNVQNVTSRGNIMLGSGEISYAKTEGGFISVSVGGTITNCETLGGSISAGAGSVITNNNIENASGTAVVTSGDSTVNYNRIVGSAQGIVASAGTIENNLIARITDIGISPGTASVRNNTFIGISGSAVYLDNIPAAFEYNNFDFNTGEFDVVVDVPRSLIVNLPAQNNWWGTDDSNLIKERIYDYYEEFELATLIYLPVLTEPSQNAPGYIRNLTIDPPSPVGIQTVDFSVEFSRQMDTLNYPKLLSYHSLVNAWSEKAPMSAARSYLEVVKVSNGKIYALGGLGPLSTLEEYDPFRDTWEAKTSMPTAKVNFGAAATSNGKIYVLGGDSGPPLMIFYSSVEEYDTLTDTWTTKAPLSSKRYGMGAAAVNGKIYVFGGAVIPDEGNSYSTDIVEMYDPLTDTWQTKEPMPTLRNEILAAAINGKIYVIGGGLSVVEVYDPITDTWERKSDMPENYYGESLLAGNNGKLYALGDEDDDWKGYEYDTLTDTWTPKEEMKTLRRGFGAVYSEEGIIYVIGGRCMEDEDHPTLSTVEAYHLPEWGTVSPNTNPHWVDEKNFMASYDFTSLNRKGDYWSTVEDIKDGDGTALYPFIDTTFTVDYAGEISDVTPPDEPTVTAWGDGSLTQLSARAEAFDQDSEIISYRYAIGTSPGDADVVYWTNTYQNQITHTGLSLIEGQNYYVSFQACNTGGLWSPIGISNPVLNGNQGVTADAGPDQFVDTMATVNLDGSASFDTGGNTPLTYNWTQEGGTTVQLDDPTSSNPSFVAPDDPDTLTFSLVVTNSIGIPSASDAVSITVENQAPVADAGVDQSVYPFSEVILDGRGSSDPDGDLPLTYLWEQTAGTPVSLSDSTSAKPSFPAPDNLETLTFRLLVTDSFGLSSDVDEVQVVIIEEPLKIFLPIILR